MNKKYTLENGAILCGGQEIARYCAESGQVSSEKPLHHKVRSAISNLIEPNPAFVVTPTDASETAPVPPSEYKEPPPPNNPALGDKCPVFIAWARRNVTPEQFAARYPAQRRVARAETATHEEVQVSVHMDSSAGGDE